MGIQIQILAVASGEKQGLASSLRRQTASPLCGETLSRSAAKDFSALSKILLE
jgi:hypothetical protein